MDLTLDSQTNDLVSTYEREHSRTPFGRAPRPRRGESEPEFKARLRVWEEGQREQQRRALLEP